LRESDASEPVRLGFELTIRGSVVELGPAESLFPATVGEFHRTYEPSIDGQRFLVATAAAEGGAAITVLVNWRQMLGQCSDDHEPPSRDRRGNTSGDLMPRPVEN